jgi:single-strand DNA-binding protein
MASLNRVILIGRLGADPEVKFLPNGNAACELRVATSKRFKPKDSDEWKEQTEWHSVATYSKTAENCGKYLAKGREVCVEGELRTRSWEDKTTGKKQYKTEVVAQSVLFIGGKGDGAGGEAGVRRDSKSARPSTEAPDDAPDDDGVSVPF